MMKKKMIASSISNLTDARYFAGWMVDYMVFNIDPKHKFHTSIQEIGTFQSWVEGPQYYLEMSHGQYEETEKFLVDHNCQGVMLPFADRAMVSALDILVIFKVTEEEFVLNSSILKSLQSPIIIKAENSISSIIEMIKETSFEQEVYIELGDQKITESQLKDSAVTGFMVHGSEEEKVGFKSYDELDEIFESLEEF